MIVQAETEVTAGMTAEALAEANHAMEYAHFPKTIAALLRERRANHKDGVNEIAPRLHALGVQIISTGGTAAHIREMGLPVTEVADLTDYPSIFGGRVKTLHPTVFGGILARRAHEGDEREMEEYEVPAIDLVIVDLYPFTETVKSGATEAEIIEKIDIGGIALIRAAAKNHRDVVIVSHAGQYEHLMGLLNSQDGSFTFAQRKELARQAFSHTFRYDNAIHHYLNGTTPGEELLF